MAKILIVGKHTAEIAIDDEGDVEVECLNCLWIAYYDTLRDAVEYAPDHVDSPT